MNRACFHELCQTVSPWLAGGHSNFKDSLPVDRKVAMSLYRLAGEILPYRVIAEHFGVSPASVCKVLQEFVLAVIEVR